MDPRHFLSAGLKDMLSYLIAGDTMHQQQWLAVIEELEQSLPVPSDFPQSKEHQEFSYSFFVRSNAPLPADSRFLQGPGESSPGRPFRSPPLTTASPSTAALRP